MRLQKVSPPQNQLWSCANDLQMSMASPILLLLSASLSTLTRKLGIVPTLKGSEVLLELALKTGPRLGSVICHVFFSGRHYQPSSKARQHLHRRPICFSFSKRTIADRDGGAKTPGNAIYGASKTATERRVGSLGTNTRYARLSPKLMFELR